MNKQYKKALIAVLFISIAIALIDIWAMNSTLFGTPEDYSKGNFTISWWPLFLKINLLLIIGYSLVYYFFIRKDKSETLGIFITGLGTLFSGLPDILFYLLRGESVPQFLPWLNNSPIIGGISRILGYTDLTSTILLISVILTLFTLDLVDKLLEKIN